MRENLFLAEPPSLTRQSLVFLVCELQGHALETTIFGSAMIRAAIRGFFVLY